MAEKVKRVLIVEDESQILDVLVRKLKKEGFNTLQARDGKTGLKMALDEKPDLILLDIILPEMDGLTLLDKLRESEAGEDIAVIVLTNLESDEKLEESRKRGVHDYLVKTDWSLEDVIGKVKKALK